MKIRVRNLFVYFLFLVIPTLIGAVWLVLPLQFNGGTNELGFFIVVGVTFYWKFFCWMVFFDLLLPGCSKLLVVTTNVAFVLGSTVIYVGIAYYDLQQIKIVFSLIGLWDAVCSVTCYAVHIWRNGGKGAHSINTQRELGLDQPLLVDDADEVIVGSSSMNTFVIPDEPKVRVFNVNDPESATPITRLCLSGKDPANDEDASPVTGISAPNLLSFVVFDYDGGSSDDEDDNNTRNFFLEEEDDGGDDEYVQMPPGFLNSGDVHIDDSDMMRVSLTSNIASSGSGEGMDNSPAPSSSRISLKSRWKRRNLEEFVTEEVAVYKRWSEPLQYSACYYPSIDEKDGRRRSDKMSPTDPRRGPLSFKTLFWGITFRMAVFLIWFGVQLFTFYFLIDENAERAATGDDGGTQANVSEGRHSSLHLAIAVGVFQLLRFVSIFALVVLARQLPSIEETRYFPIFYVFMMFFFYYRHLFVKISEWWMIIIISIFMFFLEIIRYPVRMSRRFHHFLYTQLLGSPYLKKYLPFFFKDFEGLPYDYYVEELAVQYYYDQVSEYYSMIVFVLYFVLIRITRYNAEFFPTLNENYLPTDDFYKLLLQYLYLFCTEVFSDIVCRFLIRKVLHLNISVIGRRQTIDNYRARFLYSIFLLGILLDVYFSLRSSPEKT